MEPFKIFQSKREKVRPPLTADEYYLGLGKRAKYTVIVLALVTALLIIFVASAYNDELTIENFRYMLKFIDTDAATVEVNDIVSYDAVDGNTGMLLRGNLAVYNSSGLSVYDLDGEKQFTASVRTDSTCVAVTDKHLLLCDLGGTALHAYSPYQEVYSETLDYPIFALSASDNGFFAVISSVKSYRSAVMVYSPYFSVVYTRKFGDYFANAVDISSDGSEFVTAVSYSDNGELVSGLFRFSITEEEPLTELSFAGELPISVKYLGNGGFAMLTDRALRFFSPSGELLRTEDISGESLIGSSFGDDGVALFFHTQGLSASCRMVCFDALGRSMITESFSSLPLDTVIAENHIYILSHGAVSCYDMTGDDAFSVSQVDEKFVQLLCDGDMLLLFSGEFSVVHKTFNTKQESET